MAELVEVKIDFDLNGMRLSVGLLSTAMWQGNAAPDFHFAPHDAGIF